MDAPQFTFAPIQRDNGFHMDDYWIWCPSLIEGPDGKWHLFASRWPKALPFHPGWLVASEVVRAIADKPEGPYTFAEVVLGARGPEYWDGRSIHNPTIRQHKGRYYLYYMGSTHPLDDCGPELTTQSAQCIVARSNKRVGVAWADSLEGPWHRCDQPILETQPRSFYSFLTSNPAPLIHEDGRVTMLFKSRQYLGNTHSGMSIGLAKAPTPEGPFTVIGDSPLFSPTRFGEIEDPFLWYQDDAFHVIAKDMSGELCGDSGAGIFASSKDAEHWKLGTPPIAYKRELAYTDGKTERVGSLERPFLNFQNGQPTHLAAAVSNGTINFTDATRSWIVVLPIK